MIVSIIVTILWLLLVILLLPFCIPKSIINIPYRYHSLLISILILILALLIFTVPKQDSLYKQLKQEHQKLAIELNITSTNIHSVEDHLFEDSNTLLGQYSLLSHLLLDLNPVLKSTRICIETPTISNLYLINKLWWFKEYTANIPHIINNGKSVNECELQCLIEYGEIPDINERHKDCKLLAYGIGQCWEIVIDGISGNGSVLSNWIQYHLLMYYLTIMTNSQSLHMYSGHPLGLFPSIISAPRLVISNGLTIPNYSTTAEYDRMYAIGTTIYGQMTAGSFAYIGSQRMRAI